MAKKIILPGWAGAKARAVLRKLNVNSVERLLALDIAELLRLKNCGPKTANRIKLLQDIYRNPDTKSDLEKWLPIIVLANELTESAKEQTQYRVTLSRRKYNALKKALQGIKWENRMI